MITQYVKVFRIAEFRTVKQRDGAVGSSSGSLPGGRWFESTSRNNIHFCNGESKETYLD